MFIRFFRHSLFAAVAAGLSACTSTPSPSSSPSAGRSALPLEIIPAGNGAPVHFETFETEKSLHVVAKPARATEALVDTQLVSSSNKVLSVALANIDEAHSPRESIVQFPISKARQASKIRVVYYTDARGAVAMPPDA